ncbi:hypothetical protein [Caulobacter sp. BP25]|uniref:hypothetical protein n=1 Tax=Caulobacter sp. BP25 TaxID=2048900 RepID=UPI00117E8B68|nr:hypothetical protein [Caulobacter sp. BP25]
MEPKMGERSGLYEDRWGPVGAAIYRCIMPAGLTGCIVLILPVIWATSFFLFGLYPLLVGAIAYCSWRNVVLSQGGARVLALTAGLVMTGLAVFLALGLFFGSGGV